MTSNMGLRGRIKDLAAALGFQKAETERARQERDELRNRLESNTYFQETNAVVDELRAKLAEATEKYDDAVRHLPPGTTGVDWMHAHDNMQVDRGMLRDKLAEAEAACAALRSQFAAAQDANAHFHLGFQYCRELKALREVAKAAVRYRKGLQWSAKDLDRALAALPKETK